MSHTGTGRIARMKMRPMSLYESGDSTGAVSPESFVRWRAGSHCAHLSAARNTWPFTLPRGMASRAVGLNDESALLQAPDYLDGVINSDVSRVDEKERNPRVTRALLRSYARFSASQGKVTEMLADVNAQGVQASESTVRDYIRALEQIFCSRGSPLLGILICVRKTAVRTAPTRHFC